MGAIFENMPKIKYIDRIVEKEVKVEVPVYIGTLGTYDKTYDGNSETFYSDTLTLPNGTSYVTVYGASVYSGFGTRYDKEGTVTLYPGSAKTLVVEDQGVGTLYAMLETSTLIRVSYMCNNLDYYIKMTVTAYGKSA